MGITKYILDQMRDQIGVSIPGAITPDGLERVFAGDG
jgi:hypothetical protein